MSVTETYDLANYLMGWVMYQRDQTGSLIWSTKDKEIQAMKEILEEFKMKVLDESE